MGTKSKYYLYALLLVSSVFKTHAQEFFATEDRTSYIFTYKNESIGVAEDDEWKELPFSVYLPFSNNIKYEKESWRYKSVGHYFIYEDSQFIFIECNLFRIDSKKSPNEVFDFKGYAMEKERLKPNIYFKFQNYNDVYDIYDDLYNEINENPYWKKFKPKKDRYSAYFVKDNVMVYFYNIKKDNFFNWFELVSNSFHVIPFEDSLLKK